MTSRQLAGFFFTPLEPGLYRCNNCEQTRKQAPRIGYTKLIFHLSSIHPTHGEEYEQFQRQNLTPLDVFGFADETTSNMYDWLRWIVERKLPPSEVENPLTRQLVDVLERGAGRVGETTGKEMGTSFGIMWDGWTSGTYHYVAVVAVYASSNGRVERVIGLPPTEDDQTADGHIELIGAVLAVYNKSVEMVKFVVGDNCSTNQALATKMGVPLVGCASHRYNLAMVKLLADSEDLISQVHRLMTSLRLPNNAAQLALQTHLTAEQSNATRWSSVWQMLDKYVRIHNAAKHVAAVEDLLSRGSGHHRIVSLHEKLKALNR